MATLLILGAGGHAKVVADAALESGLWDDFIFLDDSWPGRDVNGRWKVCGKINDLSAWRQYGGSAVAAVGNNRLRLNFLSALRAADFEVVSVIHPSARVSRFAKIGAGSVICANAVVNVDAELGEGCIINTGATVDHDCNLAAGVHVAPGANLGGGVTVGCCSWVGIGSAVRQYTAIGEDVVVAAGAVVVSSLMDGVTAVGVPARPVDIS